MADQFRGPLIVKTWWPEYWSPDLRTFVGQNLLQTTLAPPPPPNTHDVFRAPLYIKVRWPEYASDQRSWTVSPSLALLAPPLPPGKSTEPSARVPPSPYERRGRDLDTWFETYFLGQIGRDRMTAGGRTVIDRPPLGPVPQTDLKTWTETYFLGQIGRDRMTAGGRISYELPPLGVAKAYPNDLRSWTLSLNTTTLATPQIPPGEQVYDRPPLAAAPNADNRTWVWNYNLNLIGQDLFPVGEQVSELAPRAKPPNTDNRTWTWSYFLTLIGQDQLPVGDQSTALTVLAPYFDVSLRTFAGPPIRAVAPPFAQFDWPNPVAPAFTIDKRTWTWSYNLNLIGQDATVAGKEIYDRPPLAPIPPENLKSWIQQTNLALLTAPFPNITQTTDLPRSPLQPALGQTSSYNLNLIGQDQLPAGKQVTELAPRGIRPEDLRSWVQQTAEVLTAVVAPVGVQVDDLPPRAAQQAALGQTSSYDLNLIGQDQLPVGAQSTDRTPRPFPTTDYRSWIWYTSLALNNSLGVPVGDQLYDIPPRSAQRPADLGTWLERLKLNLLPPPFFQTDWPTPKGPSLPQRTFVNTLNLDLISAIQPFNQTDWPPPRGPALPQRSYVFSFPLELIGQDQLPPGANRYDLSPVGAPYPSNLRTSTVSPAVPPIVVVATGGETLLMMGMG